MKLFDIPYLRLVNQHIVKSTFKKPEDVVRWLGAVQSQDYAAAKWAIAQREKNLTDSDIDQAFADGTILRTHVMRPTWHFVAPEDIRWLLALTAPRVHATNAYQYRRLELDKALFQRSNAVLTKALRDGHPLTRNELGLAFRQAGIEIDHLRLSYIIIHAELDALICSGARRGKQFTYALLDERAPANKTSTRDEALAELTRRYLTSRGPATEEDLIWWSGLSRNDGKAGIEMVKSKFENEKIDGKVYWFPSTSCRKNPANNAFLLPNFDEYIVGYADRSAIFDSSHTQKLDARSNPLFQHTIVINGQLAGTWKRTIKKDTVMIELHPFAPLTNSERKVVTIAAQNFGRFLELKLEIEW
ncbi:MAG TPA: winged helix DNA-binding domain-containing protein [Anaerolineales bacterium]|nr:winged helix DNA-binding domain-containing protein [Anaerolineales bacterium]